MLVIQAPSICHGVMIIQTLEAEIHQWQHIGVLNDTELFIVPFSASHLQPS